LILGVAGEKVVTLEVMQLEHVLLVDAIALDMRHTIQKANDMQLQIS
jgi:hypothetical protein